VGAGRPHGYRRVILEINITMLVQMLVFAAFVMFTMKFVWPPIEKALQERQDKIADGLAAAERGQRELELAQHRVKSEMREAKGQATDIIDKANQRAAQIIEEAKGDARNEAERIALLAEQQIAQEVNQAKTVLQGKVAALAISGAEKIIMHEVDAKASGKLLDSLINEI